ncbi:hypothetical protein [Mycobacterium sp. SMC-4]
MAQIRFKTRTKGTDGATLVFEVTNQNAEALATARDFDSCAEL